MTVFSNLLTLTSPRRLAALVSLALGLTLLAGVGAPASAGAAYQQPHKGDCHKQTYKQVMAVSAPLNTVRCGSRGVTTVTVKAGLLPAGVDPTSGEQAWDAVGDGCYAAQAARMGRTAKKRAMSAFDVTLLLPTATQRSHGAAWYRCDVFVWRADKLTRITRSKRPMLSATVPDTQRFCYTRGYYKTSCDAAHMWRVVAAVKLSGTSYPADIDSRGSDICVAKVSTHGLYLVPSEQQWARGFRFVRCFNKQKKGTGGLAKVAGRSTTPGGFGRQVGVLTNP